MNARRLLICGLAAGVAAVAIVGASSVVPVAAPPVSAASAAPVLGRYTVKLKGDGWAARRIAGSSLPSGIRYESARVSGSAQIDISPRDAQVNDGLVTVRILLDANAAAGLLGPATPGSPAFEATAAVIGDSISLIDSGQPGYVNTLTLRFDGGKRVTGTWTANFPALEQNLATQSFATGVTATLAGRRVSKSDAGPGRGPGSR